MKNLFTAFLYISWFGSVVAQTQDSIHIKTNDFYNIYEKQLHLTPLLMVQQPLGNFTHAQLDGTHKSYNFKRVQTAEQINAVNFSTHGIFNIDHTLRLFGGINIQRTNEQNLGYNASSERTEFQNVLSPNYFLAPKKGDWKQQSYQILGGVTKTFYQHLLLGATVSYNNNKMTRDIDPRPELSIHHLGGTAHVGFQHSGHTVYGLFGMNIETQTNGILYVNPNQNAAAFPETYIRFSSGYGRIVNNNSSSNHIYKTLAEKAGVGYQYRWKAHRLGVDYSLSKSMKDLYNKDENGNVLVENNLISFKYRNVVHDLAVNYFYNNNEHSFYTKLNYEATQGDNFSVQENGQNYRSQQNFVHLNTAFIKQKDQRIKYHLGLNATYSNQRFIDLLGYTDKLINAFEADVLVGKDIFQSENRKHQLYLETSFGVYQPVKERLLYNSVSSSTFFKDDIILPDHAYDVTTRFQSGIRFNYSIHLERSRIFNIFAKYQAITSLEDNYQKYYNSLNTKYNNYLQAGISITY